MRRMSRKNNRRRTQNAEKIMKGMGTLKKLAVVVAMCMAVLCLPGYSEPTPEQIAERTRLLEHAIYSYNLEQAKLCIKLGADMNVISKTSAFTFAIEYGQKDMVELLINGGVDVNAKSGKDDDSLLRTATKHWQKDIAELLIKAGADVDAKNKYGRTALRAAAVLGHKDIVELLIKAGADVNAKASDDGWTALIGVASECGDKDIAELLIKAGADVNAKDNNGWTALMCAAHKYNWDR